VSQLLINSHQLKHEVTGNSLVTSYVINTVYFLWHDKLLFLHWKKKYKSINIVQRSQNFCARLFWDFAQIFDKSKLLWVRLHPLYPQLLHPWLWALEVDIAFEQFLFIYLLYRNLFIDIETYALFFSQYLHLQQCWFKARLRKTRSLDVLMMSPKRGLVFGTKSGTSTITSGLGHIVWVRRAVL